MFQYIFAAAVTLFANQNVTVVAHEFSYDIPNHIVTAQVVAVVADQGVTPGYIIEGVAQVEGCEGPRMKDATEGHIMILNTKNQHIEVDYYWSKGGTKINDFMARAICSQYLNFAGGNV